MNPERIKPEELRLGNHVNVEGQDVIVEGIQPWHLWTSLKASMVYWEDVQPIPLSKDWLERFGFAHMETTNDGVVFQNRKVVLSHSHNKFRLFISDTEDDWYYTTSIKIQYVHQLQNLYFSLTGTELKLKEQTV